MTTACSRCISFVAILLAVALVSFAQRPAATRAEGTADNVQDIDLARMTLPLSAYGPDYASFELDAESVGFEAEDSSALVVNAYYVAFNNPDQEAITGRVGVASAAVLFASGTDAASAITEIEASIQDGGNDEGEVTTFPVLGLDGALGIRSVLPFAPGFDLFFEFTVVLFPHDRLVGEVAFFRYDDVNVNAEAIIAANALSDRMKGVLTGKIIDFPALLPPDLDCNGSLDSIDASLVLQLGAALVDSLPCDALADANQDGRTNAIDASLILQYSAGLIDSLPVAG